MKEAEMLAQNLSGGGIGAHEIISDVNQLKCLAQLQESMVSRRARVRIPEDFL
jgi:hypothetical protein